MRIEITQEGNDRREVRDVESLRVVEDELTTALQSNAGYNVTIAWTFNMADHTYREIGILTDLWMGHLSQGKNFLARQNGIFTINYDTLIEKGMVERVPEFSEAQLKANQDAVDALKFEAMAALHVDTIRRAIEYLEDAEGIPTEQRWGYRLTEKGIQHMRAQTDAIPDYANA